MLETQGGTRNQTRDLQKKGSAVFFSSNHWGCVEHQVRRLGVTTSAGPSRRLVPARSSLTAEDKARQVCHAPSRLVRMHSDAAHHSSVSVQQ